MHYLIFFQNILSCTSDSHAVSRTEHMCNTCQNFKRRCWLLLMKDFKTFPSKTCLKHIIYVSKNMSLHVHVYIPIRNPHWLLSGGPLGLENTRPVYSESHGYWANKHRKMKLSVSFRLGLRQLRVHFFFRFAVLTLLIGWMHNFQSPQVEIRNSFQRLHGRASLQHKHLPAFNAYF